ACDAIKYSIEFFRNSYQIPVSKLLPYNALIVIFSYYFYIKKSPPVGEENRKLTDLFWNISLGYRYSSATETKLAQDIERVDKIMKGEDVNYDWSIEIEPEQIIKHGWFSTGRSYTKAILAIMASMQPRDFNNHSIVNISNDYLKVSTSKNYHHFFPKSYMGKNRSDVDYDRVNHIVNITMIGDFINKRVIKDKAPSVYMKEFIKVNEQIKDTMKTHLIDDIESWGILDDNFDKFISKRSKRISDEIKSRLINYKARQETTTNNYYSAAQEEDEEE
ncbi:MAG: hypothetical protein HAW67_05105, partial [Endozoicomonadaceae bacterium]|nr:hypothetical protein [Endozoicomonadaceae bacterium]